MIEGVFVWAKASFEVFARPLLVCLAFAYPADAQQPLPVMPSASQSPARVTGTVIDADGAGIFSARVTLHIATPAPTDLETTTSSEGTYTFDHLPACAFTIEVAASGFSPGASSGLLHPAESLLLPALRLPAAASDSISVSATQQEIAAAELRLEEKQKLLGFVPNFYVVYDWHAPPLTPRQKWQLAWADLSDPDNALIGAGIAGAEQAANALPGYGQETGGYLKRFGASYADLTIGTVLTGAALPILFHQDPRYFYKGTGSIRSRALYALSTALIARGDSGRSQPAYASVLGNFAAGALTNLVYAPGDRTGFGGVLVNGVLSTALDGATNLAQEFLLRRFTPKAPAYSPPAP